MFRKLKANEIDCRIGTLAKDGSYCTLLLYKDARVDMALLDEFIGAMNWQRKHEFKDGKLYCSVGIYDEGKGQWIWKEDIGTESNTEAEKGQASDSFKRACFNWGIGRELYTAPFIYIEPLPNEDLKKQKFFVRDIEYKDDTICDLVIVDKKGLVRYSMNYKQQPKKEELNPFLVKELENLGGNVNLVASYFKKEVSEVTNDDIQKLVNRKKGIK